MTVSHRLHLGGEIRLQGIGRRELLSAPGSVPRLAKRSITFGSFSAACSAATSLSDDVLGQSLRRPHRVPRRNLEARQRAAVERRQVRKRRDLGLGRDGVAFDLAVLDLVGGVGGLVAHDVELAADQVVHGRAGAAIADARPSARRVPSSASACTNARPSRRRRGRRSTLPFSARIQSSSSLTFLAGDGGLGHQRHRHVGDAADDGRNRSPRRI